MSEMLWISVPGGKKDNAVLRVLIAPRLEGSTLAADGMEHWPPQSLISEQAKVRVEFAETVNGPLHSFETQPIIQAKPGVWESFFEKNTIITPTLRRQSDAEQVEVDSTSSKADEIHNTFTQVAKARLADDRSAMDDAVRTELLKRWSSEEPPIKQQSSIVGDKTCTQKPDFHQTIAMLREHPTVLQALGLIIELKIPDSGFSSNFSEGIVRVCWPDAPTSIPKITSPWSKYDNDFMPGSEKNNIKAGMVNLTNDSREDGPSWKIVTVDVDNSTKKLRNAARTIANTPDNEEMTGTKKPFMLPALRTTGIMLVRRGRQEDFKDRRKASNDNAGNSISETVFKAEDLVLGYRIDINQQGRNYWSTLNLRLATYKVNEEKFIVDRLEEGHIKAHAAIRDESGALRTDEIIACWRGWSFAVPRPSSDTPAVHRCPNMPFKFEWNFSVPKGGLPRLRFAQTYQLRARVADIAGGGLEVNDPAANHYFSEFVNYQRYEPVSPPDLAFPKDIDPKTLGNGETVDQLVIRSDFDMDVSEFKSNPHRLMFPPKVSLTLCEQHKALDSMHPEQIRDMVKQAMIRENEIEPSFTKEMLFPDFAAAGVCVFPHSTNGLNVTSSIIRAWNGPWPDFSPMEIVLKDRVPGDSNIIVWEAAENPNIGDRLIVRLAKAEEIILDLSSFLRADFLDHFAIYKSLPGRDEENMVINGRHPMVNPARTVKLTHAVRRPLKEPMKNPDATYGSFLVGRSEGMSYVILSSNRPLEEIIDRNSTGKLEVTASWEEPIDINPEKVDFVPVKTVNINRDDEFLPVIQHELGDTRHRRIKYTLTAVSRFRQFFEDDDDKAFIQKTDIFVNIPSSARPSPPIVLSTRPAFVWEDEEGTDFLLYRRRLGGYLRIELKGPWYETGDEEQLAVLISKDINPIDKVIPFITQAGGDPIQDQGTKRWPTAEDFPLKSGTPQEVYIKEADDKVLAIPHKPWCKDGRWFVDIAIPSLVEEAYCPFVCLALARYQPNTINELEPISSVVVTEIVQLLPERRLRVWRDGNSVFVKLDGLGPGNKWWAKLEKFHSSLGVAAEEVDLTALEVPTDEIPAWIPVGNYPPYEYFGEMNEKLKLELPAEKGTYRIRIKEVENNATPEGGVGIPAGEFNRTVYSDVVVIPET